MPGRRMTDRAFTLVEVLVVAGILGVLLAICLPALSRARTQARSAVCLSNLRQIGAGMRMYMGDFRGWLPVGPADKLSWIGPDVAQPDRKKIYDEPGPGRKPYPWSNCHWGGRRARWVHRLGSKEPEPEKLPRPLTWYLYKQTSLDQPTPLFECPDDIGCPSLVESIALYYDESEAEGLVGRPVHEICGNSYWINPWIEREARPTTRLRNPSGIVLAEEAPMYEAWSRGRQYKGWHGRFSRHNILFLDMHAENMYVDTRGYYGPGWFIPSYFQIMDYYQ